VVRYTLYPTYPDATYTFRLEAVKRSVAVTSETADSSNYLKGLDVKFIFSTASMINVLQAGRKRQMVGQGWRVTLGKVDVDWSN
jgi:hypothetical protein